MDKDQFLNEIKKVCKKYNLSISHEDCHGSFIITAYDDSYMSWLSDAKLDIEE